MQKKEYKVESLIYYSKITMDPNHIQKDSTKDIQEKLDELSKDGWQLVSTNSTSFGLAVYIYLFFERDA